MKKRYLTIAAALMATTLSAQPQGRAAKTIVADVLAQLPTQNSQSFNNLMGDLASIPARSVAMLTDMKTPIGESDMTKVDFALGGLTSYVTSKEGAHARVAVCQAYIKALEKEDEREVRAYIIRQLEMAGGDESVEALSEIAQSDDLYQEAAHALQAIGTAKAIAAIEASLESIIEQNKMIAAKLIGDIRLEGYQDQLIEWLDTDDIDQRKAVLYALAYTGDKAALKPVVETVKAAGYDYEPTGALDSYFTLMRRVDDQAAKTAAKIIKQNPSLEARLKALSVVVDELGEDALSYVVDAVGDQEPKYRAQALDMFTPYVNDDNFEAILLAAKDDDRSMADIISWEGAPAIQRLALAGQYADSDNELLSENSMKVLSMDGGNNSIDILCSQFEDDDADLDAVSDYLNRIQAPIATPTIAVFDEASDEGKLAIIKLWGKRRVSEATYIIKDYVGHGDSELNITAREALAATSTPGDLPYLYKLLADGNSLELTQKAIVNALDFYDSEKRYQAIKSQMQKDEKNADRYFAILAGINNPAAIVTIEQALASHNMAYRNAAAQALSQWQGSEALQSLYTVASQSQFSNQHSAAVSKYIELVASNKMFSDQTKYLHLRKIAEVTTSSDNLNSILSHLSRYKSFGALLFAGDYIDNPETEQTALVAVMRIASSEPSFYGPKVRQLLETFLQKRRGGDAVYEKGAVEELLAAMPKEGGYVSIFNGKNLDGWQGLVENPISRSKMTASQLAKKQTVADEAAAKNWVVEDGILYFTGHGDNLCTKKKYGNIEMYVDWQIGAEGDAGIYLRGTPQVQIWDTTLVKVGAEVGSGGLYNNQKNPSKPLVLADGAIGDWNTFHIKMVGERVTVYLNGEKVVSNTILENYWDRKQPIFSMEQIELQAHGNRVGYRDIYVRELPETKTYTVSQEEQAQGFKSLFDGVSMNQWQGNTQDYVAEDGCIALYPSNNYGGNLYSKNEYDNFVLRFEFQLTEGANNGLGIRTPLEGDAAYVGMELQILDNEAPIYANLEEYQYHGSVYGIIPAKRGYLKPVGEWNYQEVHVNGNHIKVTLNGEVILDGDIRKASANGTLDKLSHPGLLNKSGHIAFLGHGSPVKFKNIRIKEL